MIFLNLETALLHAPEFIGSNPKARGTWCAVSLWCASQENGGVVTDALTWSDRQLQQTCGVTRAEIDSAPKLLRWIGNDLHVFAYPVDQERAYQASCHGARLGGLAKARSRSRSNVLPPAVPGAVPPAVVGATAGALPGELPKGKERKGTESNVTEGNSNSPSPHSIYAAYPLKVGKADALKAIARTLKAGAITADALLAKVQAYAAAVATWPDADRKFVPHPATWINRGSFDDDPATWQRGDTRTANGGFAGEVASVRPEGWGTELPLTETQVTQNKKITNSGANKS